MATLHVEVLEGLELTAADVLSGSSDPYVLVTIPGTSFKARTKHINSTLNPAWNEKFTFTGVGVKGNILVFEVYDKDTLTADDFIGKCNVTLETMVPEKIYHVWLKLTHVNSGKIRVKMQLLPSGSGSSVPASLQPSSTTNNNSNDSSPGRPRRNTPVKISAQMPQLAFDGEAVLAAAEAQARAIEQQIIAQCQASGKKWEDPDFTATDKSLYKYPPGQHKNIMWKRPDEFASDPQLFVAGIESGDVIQGALGDCYFLGGLSVVATRKDLLLPLFLSTHPEFGFYQMKFWKDGEWRVVTIDDRIPMYGPRPIYGRCKDINEIWVPLIEKAYAKAHGCYEAIEAGSIAAALTDLTGEGNQIYLFEEEEMQREIQSLSFWKTLLYFVSEGYLMGCSHSTNGRMEEQTDKGILLGHAYGILDAQEPEPGIRLVCLRNPWGKLEWRGRYSDNSSDWTPSLIKKLNVVFEDDGTFWMSYEDFVQQFNQMIVLRLLTDIIGKRWHAFNLKGEWNKETAGGCTNYPTWHDNPQYALSCTQPHTRVFISIAQPDVRLKWQTDYQLAMGFYVMKTAQHTIPKVAYSNEDVVMKIPFTPAREIGAELTIDPAFKYVIIPCTYDPQELSPFWLSVYGEEPIHVSPLLNRHKLYAKGEWRGQTAGGCYNNQTWVNNPKYLLTPVSQPTQSIIVSITVRQPGASLYIGCYDGQYVGRFERAMLRGAKPCCNSREFTIETVIQPAAWPHFAIPHTFDAGEQSEFEFFVSSSEPLRLELLG